MYGGLAAVNSLFTLARAFLFAWGGVRAARAVHHKLLAAVVKVCSQVITMAFSFSLFSRNGVRFKFTAVLRAIDALDFDSGLFID